MPRAPPPGFFILAAVTFFVWYVVWTRNHERPMTALSHVGGSHADAVPVTTSTTFADDDDQYDDADNDMTSVPKKTAATTTTTTTGEAIAGKLGNETLKAELGRAAWKLFHTTMARFPDKPTTEESDALKQYIHLFARLYPCGECATHFQKILKRYPPQTTSRSNAAVWACFVHNEVNKSKGKPEFDCANIGDFYDCGCADDEKEKMAAKGQKSEQVAKGQKVEIEHDGPTRGG